MGADAAPADNAGPPDTNDSAFNGRTMPAPVSKSVPGASISSAVATSAARICVAVSAGLYAFNSAATAAACGAAADVPKKGANPGTEVDTPSDAVMTGYCWVRPPPVPIKKLFGVTAVPFGLKNLRAGPSEENNSVVWLAV